MSRLTFRARCWSHRFTTTALIVHLLSTVPVFANGSTQTADQHFRQGLAAAGAGKMTLAAAEFERAYDAAPHYSVLYNLGLVYAALGRNADAVRVFGRYLIDGGEKIASNRRQEVEGIVKERSVGLAHVSPRILPAGATVTLDARTLAPAELGAPIPVDPGRHLLAVRRDGYKTSVHPFDVAAGETANLEVVMTPVVESAPAPKMVAFFTDCPIPDVEFSIDGESVTLREPHAARVASEGQHLVRFARGGYSADERSVEIREGQRIQCRLRPLAPPPPEVAATLQIALPPGATAFVDGARFLGGPVPAGRHRVIVLQDGHSDWQRDVDVPKGRTVRLEPNLTPTPERRRREESIDTRRTWALVSGGAGVALLGTAVGLYVVNGDRYAEWEADSAAFSHSDGSPAELKQEAAELQGRAASIQQLDDLALSLGAAGLVALGTGAVLYFGLPSNESEPSSVRASVSARGLELAGTF